MYSKSMWEQFYGKYVGEGAKVANRVNNAAPPRDFTAVPHAHPVVQHVSNYSNWTEGVAATRMLMDNVSLTMADGDENDNVDLVGFLWRTLTSIINFRDTVPHQTAKNDEIMIVPKVISVVPDPTNMSYVPTGIVGQAKRLFRRRLLNLLERSDQRWPHAVGPYSDPIAFTVSTTATGNASYSSPSIVSDSTGGADEQEMNSTRRGLFRQTSDWMRNYVLRKRSPQTNDEENSLTLQAPYQQAISSADYNVFASKRKEGGRRNLGMDALTSNQKSSSWILGRATYQLLSLGQMLQKIDLTGQYPSVAEVVENANATNETSETNSHHTDDAASLVEMSEFVNVTNIQRTGISLRNLVTAGKEVVVDSTRATLRITSKFPGTWWQTSNTSANTFGRQQTVNASSKEVTFNSFARSVSLYNDIAGADLEQSMHDYDDRAMGQDDDLLLEPAQLSVSQRMWNAIPYLRGSDSQVPDTRSSNSIVAANGNPFAGKDGQLQPNEARAHAPQHHHHAGAKGKRRSTDRDNARILSPTRVNSSATQDLSAEYSALLPSKADFAYIATRRTELAVDAALSVNSGVAAQEFMKHIGLKPLLTALLGKSAGPATIEKADAVKSLSRLVRFDKSVAVQLSSRADVLSLLCDMMEAPLKGFRSLQSQAERERNLNAQREATALVERMVRSSDAAVDLLRSNERLRKVLAGTAQFDIAPPTGSYAPSAASTWASEAVVELQLIREGKVDSKAQSVKTFKVRKQSNETAVAEYEHLQTRQMARVASWGLGGVTWRPKVPGQKGLRILSLDGGGTRGVLSIAYLKEIMKRVNRNLEPYQMFDIICGTSTGGIIAALLGAQRASLAEAEVLYDAFIDKIFAQRSNLRLVTEQAAYDGRDWEKILYDMCGDQLLLDTNQHDCARFFCISTKVNVNPPLPNLWRNYNYPPGQSSRYPGACRVNTFTAIRATTAAPTFFTPVQWESGLYCDGALVANNPTAIALQEAKVRKSNAP